MNTLYLKFTDEADAIAVLEDYRGTDEAGNAIWLTGSNEHALDVVGTIYKPTGEIVDEVPVMAPLAGYHVNLLLVGDVPAALEAYSVIPSSPSQVFA